MKYKFQFQENKKRAISPDKKKKYALKGRNFVRPKKQNQLVRSHLGDDFGMFSEEVEKKWLSATLSRSFSKIKTTFIEFIRKVKKRKRQKSSHSFPPSAMFGIFCSAALCLTLSVFTVILSCFFKYGGPYQSINIPDLISRDITEVTDEFGNVFDYEIVYKTNPSLPPNSIISQSPSSDITRKLYSGKKIKLSLTVNREPEEITLQNIVGSSARDVVLFLENSGIDVQTAEEYSSTVPKGVIIASSMPSGSKLHRGEKILLKVSKGKRLEFYPVPPLSGLSEFEALAKLSSSGFEVGTITYAASEMPVGTVISQSASAGTNLPEKQKISFVVSGGIYYEDLSR